jgi:multimeric flavodoxin WrbA
MNVLGLNGSPHAGGSTAAGLRAAFEELENLGAHTALLNLSEMKLDPCQGCRICDRKGTCAIDDDGPALLAALRECDAVLIGSPVHFGMVSGQLKVAMDRTRPLRVDGFALAGKLGAGLAFGAARNGGQEFVLQQIQAFLLIHGMAVVGDGPPSAHFGVAGVGEFCTDETSKALALNLARNLHRALVRSSEVK